MSAKVVLITGCSSGIGRALAAAFAAQGCRVYATARRIEALATLENTNIRCLALDVDSADSIQSALQHVQSESGRLDMLVNNAGFAAMGPLAELPIERLRQQFETNVIAPIALIQAALPLMAQGARVVNIGSVSGILTTPFAGAYCATKTALHSLSDALRMELSPLGIEVITVQPGGIESEFGRKAGVGLDWLTPSSRYAAIRSGIEARANASQDAPTPTSVFARQMVAAVLAAAPAPVIRIGHGSTMLPLIARWLPLRWRDRMLQRRFRLDQLANVDGN